MLRHQVECRDKIQLPHLHRISVWTNHSTLCTSVLKLYNEDNGNHARWLFDQFRFCTLQYSDCFFLFVCFCICRICYRVKVWFQFNFWYAVMLKAAGGKQWFRTKYSTHLHLHSYETLWTLCREIGEQNIAQQVLVLSSKSALESSA